MLSWCIVSVLHPTTHLYKRYFVGSSVRTESENTPFHEKNMHNVCIAESFGLRLRPVPKSCVKGQPFLSDSSFLVYVSVLAKKSLTQEIFVKIHSLV